ncbi:hypothetical protein A1O3_04705 [Capronia epimyces CBS 606.96]|uniref:Aminotransferase n=1 Tax=Capronia epimyces CBS 606.96 TaxID=1182542 RepID=W9XUY9_9EURO|nr:uncharacterized protein A1O3_04705 [Capronia epimyces CBS 606.96]EXJ84038.1 hypothetical protein A1O3_04705 [Capronia epimyces CBS 606.96]
MIMPVNGQSTAIFHRSLNKEYDTASSGSGVYIVHSDGSRTLDGSSGAAVSCLGHGHPVVIEAIVQQARKLAFAHSSFFTSDPAEQLAQLLIEQSAGAFTKVMFLSSGSEAVESAIKMARQYHVSRGEAGRVNFICREYAYHGNTLGALSAGFNPPRRQAFEPLLSSAFHHVSPCFFTRDAKAEEDEEAYVDRLMAEYEEMFDTLGPSSVAAVLIEPMSGATLGAVHAARGYLARLRDLCDTHGALLIFDEVMCGMGRPGTLHAWQALGNVAPDLQTIGKGLGAGYQPISAVLVGSKVHQVMQSSQSSHPFISGHTYQGHSIGCAAALATQQTIIHDNLLANVVRMGELLDRELREQVPMLKEIRGLGLFKAAEFATSPTCRIAADVARTCFSKGAAVYLCSPAVDAIVFAPPFIINEREVKELVKIVADSTKDVLEEQRMNSVK